jgi:hypothetical protein
MNSGHAGDGWASGEQGGRIAAIGIDRRDGLGVFPPFGVCDPWPAGAKGALAVDRPLEGCQRRADAID